MKKLIIKAPMMPDAVISHHLTLIQLEMQKSTSPTG
jgi:hypothetical protein